MSHSANVARILGRNLLADVQVAVGSGSWVVSDMADPTVAIIELETILGLPASPKAIGAAVDKLAACCGAAISGGDWLTPANDVIPFAARTAVLRAEWNEASDNAIENALAAPVGCWPSEIENLKAEDLYDRLMHPQAA